MILVIGGSYQGKTAFARQLAAGGVDADEVTAGGVKSGKVETDIAEADGQTASLEEILYAEVVLGFHHYIKRLTLSGQEVEPFVRQVIEANPRVVVMTEVGYGIVPLAAEERQYREAVGHAGQILAAQAESVYRLVCGIAVKIK